jgi:two-component system cell cycle response regulator DivK
VPSVQNLSSVVALPPLVLIVEDHEETRMAWTEYFEQIGFRVAGAADGNAAVAAALLYLPDAIVMDLTMPLLDGWEATRLLKSYMGTRRIPIVACSAYGYAGGKKRALEAGCSTFVPKPCRPDELAETVERLLAASRGGGEA